LPKPLFSADYRETRYTLIRIVNKTTRASRYRIHSECLPLIACSRKKAQKAQKKDRQTNVFQRILIGLALRLLCLFAATEFLAML
jgi:hypothetical protein